MKNPAIFSDYPDVDVIRVGDTYYMVSTTMHMFPGGDILMSKDMLHWELCCHVYDKLDGTASQRLKGGQIYGQGMWAACIRFHEGLFHLFFVCNDTHKTYHFTAKDAKGPWQSHDMEGFYHDCSVLFDDDGRVYIAYGNREIHITELKKDLTAPLPGGLDRIAVVDRPDIALGYEGSHFYKINGKYYLFFIHWDRLNGGKRAEACFVSDSVDGEFVGRDVLDDDMGVKDQGVAQGGIVDTPEGEWYSMLFQDHGAVGRIPVLVPLHWENDFPVFDAVPAEVHRPGHEDERPLKPLVSSDSLRSGYIESWWQWNHEPDDGKWQLSGDGLTIMSGAVTDNPEFAINTITQRTFGPKCAFEVTVDASALGVGDRAGLLALQGHYAAILVERTEKGLRLVLRQRCLEDERRPGFDNRYPGADTAEVELADAVVRLRADFDFTDLRDTVAMSYDTGAGFAQLGNTHHLAYRLDHFMGVRIGLTCYSTVETGGSATFRDFKYISPEEL